MARVLLLFGGRSSEHEVSCSSAVSVFDALEGGAHRVIPVGIDRAGEWFLADSTTRPFRAEGRPVTFALPDGQLRIGGELLEFDVAFPVMHGPHGEDGTVQGLLETANVPYVGCGVLGSALAMDKDLAKTVVAARGMATAAWHTVHREQWDADPAAVVDASVASLSFPMFVKPSAQGSSIGVGRVADETGLKDAIAQAFRYDDKVIVENGIDGREIEVAVLDGPQMSLPGEVRVAGGWYTYDAKYADESSAFDAPADLADDLAAEVRILAGRVFTALGLNGLARIDFFYDRSTGSFVFNEANTMPGFTSISGFPKMWAASGLAYPELCSHLVSAAIEQHASRNRLATR
ncbi:MAG: D-alanine--D-alanine ligase family protein [Acidimicrobiia bacterium]